LVTTGSSVNYIESYSLQSSKDRKSWKTYRDAVSKEKKAYTDGHLRVLNNLFPAVVARFVRLQPLNWHGRASAQVQLLGCPAAKATPRSRPPGESPSIKYNMDTLNPSPSPTPSEKTLLVETIGMCFKKEKHCILVCFSELHSVLTHTFAGPSQPVMVAVGVVLGMVTCGSCLLAGIWWKRRYGTSMCWKPHGSR
ncbi:hypothetical protein XENOCAPTIV_003627, partial [Xenoophorus captivus]